MFSLDPWFSAPMFGALAPDLVADHLCRKMMKPRPQPSRPWEQRAAASAEAVTFRFGLRGLRWGRPGPVVLLLHGWEGRPTQFAALIDPLLKAGYQPIALAAPAHGSPTASEAHVFAFAEAALEAAGEIGPLHAAIGHSMGAAALLYAAREGMAVQRLVALAAPVALKRFLQRTARGLGMPSAVANRLRRAFDRVTGFSSESMDLTRIGPALRQPTLLVHDRDDPQAPYADALELRRAWPTALTLTTDGLGHNRVLADPAVIAAVGDFLCGSTIH